MTDIINKLNVLAEGLDQYADDNPQDQMSDQCVEDAKTVRVAVAEIEKLMEALQKIAGKNDLRGVADDLVQTAACNALYECELIARSAIEGLGP